MYNPPLFGSVALSLPFCPTGVVMARFNPSLCFFMGDRWQKVGDVTMVWEDSCPRPILQMPDIEGIMAERIEEDEGVLEWVMWGARVN
jgi:hypothetical protein